MEGLISQFKDMLQIRLRKSYLNCGSHRENTDVQHLQNNVLFQGIGYSLLSSPNQNISIASSISIPVIKLRSAAIHFKC